MLSILTGLSSRAAGALSVKSAKSFYFWPQKMLRFSLDAVSATLLCTFFIMYYRNRVLYKVNI